MYDISMDSVESALFYSSTLNGDVNEGENRIHLFTVAHFFENIDYLWPVFKLPSGTVRNGARITLSAADYTADDVTFMLPDSLLTENGKLKVQVIATDSPDDILDIADAYGNGTFTGKIAKSLVYEFYINYSIDPMGEIVPQPGGLSEAAKAYIEDLVDDLVGQVISGDLSSKADKDNTKLTGSLSLGRTSGSTVGSGSSAVGVNLISAGTASHAEGYNNAAHSNSSHAEGNGNLVTGISAHAEGSENTASGDDSHVEGYSNEATEDTAHAEGDHNLASGVSSHAEGSHTKATQMNAHAEGYGSWAGAGSSHAEGEYTLASSVAQHVEGKFNVEDDQNKYAHILGNGTANNARSNAHTVRWDGTSWYKGGIKIGGSSDEDYQAAAVLTERISTLYTDTFTPASISALIYSSTGTIVQNYADTTMTAASNDLLSVLANNPEISFLFGDLVGNFDIYPRYDTDSPTVLVGYSLCYNAAPYDAVSWRKTDDSKNAIVVTVGVSGGAVTVISTINLTSAITLFLAQGLSEVAYSGNYNDLSNKLDRTSDVANNSSNTTLVVTPKGVADYVSAQIAAAIGTAIGGSY